MVANNNLAEYPDSKQTTVSTHVVRMFIYEIFPHLHTCKMLPAKLYHVHKEHDIHITCVNPTNCSGSKSSKFVCRDFELPSLLMTSASHFCRFC